MNTRTSPKLPVDQYYDDTGNIIDAEGRLIQEAPSPEFTDALEFFRGVYPGEDEGTLRDRARRKVARIRSDERAMSLKE